MKVVHLKLNEPHNGEIDFFFGSLKAIYDAIPQNKIGIAYKSLTNAIRGKNEYHNKRCKIKIGQLQQKKQSNFNAT
jgi:hypothetical protein